jgi:hypothetical protein
VGHVVRHEPDRPRVQAGQRFGEELGCPPGVLLPQPVPRVAEPERGGVAAQGRVEGVGDGVQVGRVKPGRRQAPGGRQLGKFPRREGDRALAVFASAEAFLLGGGHDSPVHHQRRRRVVEDRVDSENLHD